MSLNKVFSASAIQHAEGLVTAKADLLCQKIVEIGARNKPVNLSRAFRCFTQDVISTLCFGESLDCIEGPNFGAPAIKAMEAAAPVFARFKYAPWYKQMIMNCPPSISTMISPSTAGLNDLTEICNANLNLPQDHITYFEHTASKRTILQLLRSKEANKNQTVPDQASLYDEMQALMFGGGDTVGNALMVCTFHLLKNRDAMAKLKGEMLQAWPDIGRAPSARALEALPYLQACIKEGLRLSCGVISGLPRVVPASGATICGTFVPGGTVVSCGSTFVHYNADIFPDPEAFRPERWLDSCQPDGYLVAFSKGPRSCIGINLAQMELRVMLARVGRLFEWELDAASPDKLEFRDRFLPQYTNGHIWARARKLEG